MRRTGAGLQSALAALGLVAAYTTWQRAPERAVGDVEVLELTRAELQKVRYDDGSHWAELTPGQGRGEPKVWLRLGSYPAPLAPAVPDGGAAADGGALARKPAPLPPPERQLRGNELSERDWEAFAPLMASRALGKLDDAKLKELGLAGSNRHLEVWGRGRKSSFTVAPSSLGLGSSYLRSLEDGAVYLLGGTVIGDLDGAQNRLVDRQLHSLRMDEVDAFTVKAGAAVQGFTVRFSAADGALTVLPKGSQKPDAFAKNWHEKLFRLWPVEVLGRGEQPAQGVPQVAFRVEYSSRDKAGGFVEVGRAGTELYARSEGTAGWARLAPSAEDLVTESKKMVAAIP